MFWRLQNILTIVWIRFRMKLYSAEKLYSEVKWGLIRRFSVNSWVVKEWSLCELGSFESSRVRGVRSDLCRVFQNFLFLLGIWRNRFTCVLEDFLTNHFKQLKELSENLLETPFPQLKRYKNHGKGPPFRWLDLCFERSEFDFWQDTVSLWSLSNANTRVTDSNSMKAKETPQFFSVVPF